MDHPGAVILGNEYQALGLLRQLRPLGIRCVLVDEDAWGPALFSRYRGPFHRSPAYASEDFWPWLVRIAREQAYAGWLLIPTHDEQVRQIARHRDEAQALFRYCGPDWDAYQVIYDKRRSYQWCLEHAVNAPVSYLPQRREDLPGPELGFPCIVKPAFKRNFGRYTHAKAIRVHSPRHLAQTVQSVLKDVPVEELLYQEIIPGDGACQWSYAGLFVEGKPIAAFTACRMRQHPPDFGRASTFVAAVHDPEVERESKRVTALLNFTGLGEVEWKRDSRDGALKFLELNARCWGWHSLASRVVGNLPAMLLDHLDGKQLEPVVPKYGTKWVKYITDVPVVLDLMRRGELRAGIICAVCAAR